MKKYVFLILIFLMVPTTLGAQTLGDARQLYAAGNWETAKEAYTDIYEKSGPKIQVEAALEISGILWEQGKYAAAYKWTEKTKALIEKTGRKDLTSRRLFTVGNIFASQSRFGKSYKTLQSCQTSAKNNKDLAFEILCRISGRFVRQIQGKSTSSKKQYQADLKKLKSTGNPMLVGTALAKMASLRDASGRYGDAIQLLKLAHAQFKSSKSAPAVSRNRLRLAAVYQNAGQWAKSEKQLSGLVSSFRNMNNRPALVTVYSLNARQAQQVGDTKNAKKYLNKAKASASSLSSPQIRAQVDLGFCELYSDAKHLDNSKKYCNAAHEKFAKIGLWTLAARSKIMLAGVAQSRRELPLAEASYKSALGILERIGSQSIVKRDVAFQKTNYCQVSWELKRADALKICEDANRSFGGLKKDSVVYNAMARSHYLLAHLAKSGTGRVSSFENAARLFEKGGDNARSADALLRASEKQKSKTAIPLLKKGLLLLEGKTDRVANDVRRNLLTHLSEDYLENSDWTNALTYLEQLKKEAIKQKDWISLSWSANARAKAYMKTKRGDDAIKALAECVVASKKSNDKSQEDLCEKNRKRLAKGKRR